MLRSSKTDDVHCGHKIDATQSQVSLLNISCKPIHNHVKKYSGYSLSVLKSQKNCFLSENMIPIITLYDGFWVGKVGGRSISSCIWLLRGEQKAHFLFGWSIIGLTVCTNWFLCFADLIFHHTITRATLGHNLRNLDTESWVAEWDQSLVAKYHQHIWTT